MSISPQLDITHPVAKELLNNIDHYYFYKGTNPTTHIEFVHFPHYKPTLNCFKNATVQLSEFTRHVSPHSERNHVILYHRHLNFARKAIIQGPFDSIGIVFKPLGVYHFIDDKLEEQGYEFEFTQFGALFDQLTQQLFDINSIKEKTFLLDQYFIEHYRPFKKPVLKKAIDQVLHHQGDLSLQALCKHLNMNRRTLLRYFKQYMKCSYREFKNVVKFRTAFDQYFQSDKPQKLSELAYWANYYDQSDFIQQFKNKTNETPKELLHTITPASDNKLLWKFSADKK